MRRRAADSGAALDDDAQRLLMRGLSLLTRFVADFEVPLAAAGDGASDVPGVGAPVRVNVKCVSDDGFVIDTHAHITSKHEKSSLHVARNQRVFFSRLCLQLASCAR